MIYPLLVLIAFFILVVLFIRQIVRIHQKTPMHYGLLFAVILFTWWITGLVYTLGHTLFTGLISQQAYNTLGYPIAGPFLLLSEYMLSPHTHIIFHVLIILAVGFGLGMLFGLLRKRISPAPQ